MPRIFIFTCIPLEMRENRIIAHHSFNILNGLGKPVIIFFGELIGIDFAQWILPARKVKVSKSAM